MNDRSKTSQRESRCRVVIIGLGHGGCNTIAHTARQWKDCPELVALDTDISAVPKSPRIRSVQIGKDVMKGMGTGGDPRVGRRAAESDIDVIRELFIDADLVFLVVGLGGGTGTGAAPLVLEKARSADALTLCFAMLPFEFEGKQRMKYAEMGLAALQEAADGVICLPNQRLFKTGEKRANISKAFQKADDMLSRGVHAVWRAISMAGGVSGINLDFADLRALIKNSSGRCVFGCAEGTGPDKVNMVLKSIRNNPLLDHGQVMMNAYSFLVSIAGGPDLSLHDVDQIMAGILSMGNEDALIKTGVCSEPDWKDKVFLTVLVSEKKSAQEPESLAPAAFADMGESEDRVTGKKGGPEPAQAKKMTQASLFEGHSRFMGVDPTIVEGSNLDIPTYIRRGILIQKARNNS